MLAARAALLLPLVGAANREYFVRASEQVWDYAPSGMDLMDNIPLDGHADGDVFLVNRPEDKQIGSRYIKCLLDEYTDGSFTEKKPREPWRGFNGPTFYGEVGDRLAISFKNDCGKSLTLHPHGVKYTKMFEGAPYNDGRDGRGDHVQPGEIYTYLWVCDENSGPGPDDASSVSWLYHSHDPTRVDVNSGVLGNIVITRRGEADANAMPLDVDVNFPLFSSVTDESQSYLLDRNIEEFMGWSKDKIGEGIAEYDELLEDEHFLEGNLMHGLNGFLYGNLKGFDLKAGQRVRWYLFALGSEPDLHSIVWKGHPVVYRGQLVTAVQLMAGVSSVADMRPTQAGTWAVYCHTNDHIVGGMIASYQVQGTVPERTHGRVREYFIQSEEVLWDWAPTGKTLFGDTVGDNEDAAVFLVQEPGRIGKVYLKCIYKGYTDATFSTELVRSAEDAHMGMLGPAIRAEVGDTLRIVFSNKCTKSTSINVPAVLKEKAHEGASYGRDNVADGGVVAPGGTHTYEWVAARGPGPKDLTSVAFTYVSHDDLVADTSSGLIGPLVITDFGSADADARPLGVAREIFLLMTVTDEGASYLIEKNIATFVNPDGHMSDAEIEELMEDEDFAESNLMHGINGRMYGNLDPLVLSAGQRTRLYSLSVGTEVDLHSLRIQGHSLLTRGERRAQLNLMPGDVQEADFVPTAGTWAVYCQTNDHIAAGMIGRIHVEPSPLDDPRVVHETTGKVRRYYLQAELVEWDYGVTGLDQTGQYGAEHWGVHEKWENKANAFEDGDGGTFMAHDPAQGLIGRIYTKCVFVGYDETFSVKEEHTDRGLGPAAYRASGSKWEHLGVLGPIIHAEEGDEVHIVLRNKCEHPVSLTPQIALIDKGSEGFGYEDADGNMGPTEDDAVAPGGSHTYKWLIADGPGPNDPSSIGTLYYSMAQGMVSDTYSGLKGPLVITKRGWADEHGRPRDVATELVVLFEVTDEGSSYMLNHNVAKKVLEQGGAEATDGDLFEESNLMHAMNGLMYANLQGLTMYAETKVRWYLISLGTEVDLHTVHWHGHTVLFAGHRLDTVMNMPATGVTADMYTDNVGTWLIHCHITDHIEGGMVATYTVTENPERGEAQISTCQQMYGRAADVRRENFDYDDSKFEGYTFQVDLSPYFRVAYSVNYAEEKFDMMLAGRTTGWLGLGFFSQDEQKDHAMINTDMVWGAVKRGQVEISDRFAQGLETPKLDTTLGGQDQLSNIGGAEENGVTYLTFTRSFAAADRDEFDFAFGADLEQVQVVYAYSSINSDNPVYHGPTRGYAKIPWNMNCSEDHFFNMTSASCAGCDRGYYRGVDGSFALTRCERCPKDTFASKAGDRRAVAGCERCGFEHAMTAESGSTAFSDCSCQTGFYHHCTDCRATEQRLEAAFCRPCPAGMACAGGLRRVGQDWLHVQPTIPAGFYATAAEPTLAYKCRSARHCPGGVEQCAPGRTDLACGRCEKNYYSDDSSSGCSQCEDGDAAPMVLCVLAGMLAMPFLHALVSQPGAKTKVSVILAMSVSGITVTSLQTLTAFEGFNIEWQEPLKSLMRLSQIFAFDIEIIKLACLTDMGTTGVFLSKVLVLPFLIVLLLASDGFIRVFYESFPAAVRSLIPPLDKLSRGNTIGFFMMVFYVSLVQVSLTPLLCYEHPTGDLSVTRFPHVLCDGQGTHAELTVIAVLSLCVSLSFLAYCYVMTKQYPKQVLLSNFPFIARNKFLFSRFRPEAYQYGAGMLTRNLIIATIPVTSPWLKKSEIGLMMLVFLLAIVFVSWQRPWKAVQANSVEITVFVGLAGVLTCGALITPQVNSTVVMELANVCSCVMIICILVAFIYTSKRFWNPFPSFDLYLCHDKEACGGQVRLVELLVTSLCNISVFADKPGQDGSQMLGLVNDFTARFDYVRCRTKNLVVFGTQQVLTRPACAGEVTVAMIQNVPMSLVVYPEFGLTDKAIDAPGFLESYVQGWSTLTQYSLSREKVGEAFKFLLGRTPLRAPLDNTKQAFCSFVDALLTNAGQRPAQVEAKAADPASADVVFVVDQQDREALAAARLVQYGLAKRGLLDHKLAVLGDADSKKVPSFGKHQDLLVCCTPGLFDSQNLMHLVSHLKAGGKVVPIICSKFFEFPHGETLLKRMQEYSGKGVPGVTDTDVGAAISLLFKTIAVTMNPLASDEEISEVVDEIKRRIEAPVAGDVADNFGREAKLVADLKPAVVSA